MPPSQTFAEELGIRLAEGREAELFRWFLAALLYGKRISAAIATQTYRAFEEAGLLSPERILDAGWDRLVEVLDAGGYVRYDYSTATKLLEAIAALREHYGSLAGLHGAAANARDLEGRLLAFRGIGPVTVNIFLRELRPVWRKADPEPLEIVRQEARRRGIDLTRLRRKTWKFVRLEAGLLRSALERKRRSRKRRS